MSIRRVLLYKCIQAVYKYKQNWEVDHALTVNRLRMHPSVPGVSSKDQSKLLRSYYTNRPKSSMQAANEKQPNSNLLMDHVSQSQKHEMDSQLTSLRGNREGIRPLCRSMATCLLGVA